MSPARRHSCPPLPILFPRAPTCFHPHRKKPSWVDHPCPFLVLFLKTRFRRVLVYIYLSTFRHEPCLARTHCSSAPRNRRKPSRSGGSFHPHRPPARAARDRLVSPSSHLRRQLDNFLSSCPNRAPSTDPVPDPGRPSTSLPGPPPPTPSFNRVAGPRVPRHHHPRRPSPVDHHLDFLAGCWCCSSSFLPLSLERWRRSVSSGQLPRPGPNEGNRTTAPDMGPNSLRVIYYSQLLHFLDSFLLR